MAGYFRDKAISVLTSGFNVIPILPGSKRPSVDGWQSRDADEGQVQRWMANGKASHGIGIPTKRTPFADLDIRDENAIRHLIDYATKLFGESPLRIGDSPKCGLLFRTSRPFKKLSSRIYRDAQGRKAQVEILCDGQQFVAYHIHPDTKQPYRWVTKDNPENTMVFELPELIEDGARKLIAEFERYAASRGWTLQDAPGALVPADRPDFMDDDDFGLGTDPLGLTEEEIRDKVMVIPNGDRFDAREDWLKIGFAIHHETGGSEFGREVWLDWSEQHGSHNAALFDKAWNSFGKRDNPNLRGVTFRFILKLAKEYQQQEKAEQVAELLKRMDAVTNTDELRTVAADCQKLETDLVDRSRLVNAMQRAFKSVTGAQLGIGNARDMVKYKPDENTSWLENWVYLSLTDRFFNTDDKRAFTKPAFDNTFSRFVPKDASITPSFHALTNVQIPTYDLAIYMPNEAETFKYNRLSAVNFYSDALVPPIPLKLTKADQQAVALVEQHFRNICPTDDEFRMLLSWLRYIAIERDRPNWAIIIQGPGGDGKTLIAMMMAAILGPNNVYMMNASTLDSRFTSWSHGHLLCAIEEIYVSGQKYMIVNRIKPYITNDTIESEGKNKDPVNVPNTQAYLGFTNYRAALPIEDDDRRYYIIMSRWRDADDFAAFMADKPNYFDNLVAAIRNHAGAIRKWLEEWPPHPKFTAKGRAPYSHGRQQMAALNQPDEKSDLRSILKTGNRRDISNELVLTSSAVEALYGEGALVQALAPKVTRLMADAGFDHLGRIRVRGMRQSVWSRMREMWPDNGTLGIAIRKYLDDEL